MAGGSIGSGKYLPGRETYVAAKYFLYGYVEQIAHTLPRGHTINMIAPGPVLSNMTQGSLDPSKAVSPELTAQCVIDLLSDDCTTTGAIISAQTGKAFVLRGVPSDRTDVATLGTHYLEEGSLTPVVRP